MRTNSIKIITLASKKIMLQKKILKYQEIIKEIDEAIEEDINYKSDFEDFEIIFKKLVLDFNHLLNDDKDNSKIENKNEMQVDKI